MTRREALIVVGLITAAFTGKRVYAEDKETLPIGTASLWNPDEIPDVQFSENAFRNLIIERKDGTKTVIPWKEVVEALIGGKS